MNLRLLAAASAAVLVSACASMSKAPPPPAPAPVAEAPPAPPPAPPKPKPEIGTFGFNVEGMDKSVAPGDDFFRYAVGHWVDTTEIPADRSSLGSFVVIAAYASGTLEPVHPGRAPFGVTNPIFLHR